MGKPISKVASVQITGPLAPFASEYRAKLREHGYTSLTIVNELRQVAHLSRWLEERRMTEADLTRELVNQFVCLRRESRCSANTSMQALVPLLEILDEQGVARAVISAVPASPVEALLTSFEKFLLCERGLSPSTAAAYVLRARRFLSRCAPDADLSRLSAKQVTDGVLAESVMVSVGSTQFFVVAVRSFLRFCLIEGLVTNDLSTAVLSLTGRRRSPIAQRISERHARALLRSCDRRSSEGRRDFAILVLLLRLGLRASEVAGLQLDDFDWRAGEIVVRGKGRREDRLPLPSDVGKVIAAHLQRSRSPSAGRDVFLRGPAPNGPLGRGGVSTVVRRACQRAGVPAVGAHRLRHTLACVMVDAGVPLTEISQVLRHASLTASVTYARVDVEGLRAVAKPWPGVEDR